MSMISMANAAAARRPDILPLNLVPFGLDGIAKAATTTPTAAPAPAPGGAPAQGASSMDTAFNVLFGYIPGEVLTLYVAVLAAIHQPNGISSAMWTTFWCFLVATPVVQWLLYAAKVKAAQSALPLKPGTWPLWEMFAATLAFCAWAFALPNNPFTAFQWYSAALSGVVVLVASTVLGLIAPFFQRPLGVSGGNPPPVPAGQPD